MESCGAAAAASWSEDLGDVPPQGRFYLLLNEVGQEKRLYVPLNKACISVGVSSRSDVVLPLRTLFGIDVDNPMGLYMQETPRTITRYREAEFRLKYRKADGGYVVEVAAGAGLTVEVIGVGDMTVKWPRRPPLADDRTDEECGPPKFSIVLSLSVVEASVPMPMPMPAVVPKNSILGIPKEVLCKVAPDCGKIDFHSRVLAAAHSGFRDLAGSIPWKMVEFDCKSYDCIRVTRMARLSKVKRLVQLDLPIPIFKTSCMKAWAYFLERAKGLEVLETCLLPCPKTKLAQLDKLKTLILSLNTDSYWDSMGFSDDEFESLLMTSVMTSPEVGKVAGNLTTLSIKHGDYISQEVMADLNGAEFFRRFSALTELLMTPCPFEDFWSTAPQVALDRLTRLDMWPATEAALGDYLIEADDRFVIDISRMPNLTFLRCIGVKFGALASQHLETLHTYAVVGNEGGDSENFCDDPEFWPILSKGAPNVRNLSLENPLEDCGDEDDEVRPTLDLDQLASYLSSSRVECAQLTLSWCSPSRREDPLGALRFLARVLDRPDPSVKYLDLILTHFDGDCFPRRTTPEEVLEVLGPERAARAKVKIGSMTLRYSDLGYKFSDRVFEFHPSEPDSDEESEDEMGSDED